MDMARQSTGVGNGCDKHNKNIIESPNNRVHDANYIKIPSSESIREHQSLCEFIVFYTELPNKQSRTPMGLL